MLLLLEAALPPQWRKLSRNGVQDCAEVRTTALPQRSMRTGNA